MNIILNYVSCHQYLEPYLRHVASAGEIMNILVLLTCFNRKEKTEKCIKSLSKGNSSINFTFIVVDDNSKDGTVEMLEKLREYHNIYIIKGNGNLFYSGGMRMGMEYALRELEEVFDYILLVNDDVEFFDKCIEKMIREIKSNSSVTVGATCNKEHLLTYGAIKYSENNSIKYRKVDISEYQLQCDTFNANCVLIPYFAFKKVRSMDSSYIHALGDFDYGLALKKSGLSIYSSSAYIGLCENNSIKNTWQDTTLSRIKRIKLKENPKGAPLKPWFYFLKKNFGFVVAIRNAFTPYARILLRK